MSSVQLVPKQPLKPLYQTINEPFKPFDYDEFLEAVTPVWNQVKIEKAKQAKKTKPKSLKPKIKVVKKKKERKLALDKDI